MLHVRHDAEIIRIALMLGDKIVHNVSVVDRIKILLFSDSCVVIFSFFCIYFFLSFFGYIYLYIYLSFFNTRIVIILEYSIKK